MSIDISTLAVEVKSTGIKETADGLNSVFKEAKKAEDRVVTLTSKIEKLSAAFVEGSATSAAFQQSMAKTKATQGGIDTAMQSLSDTVGKLSKQIGSLNTNLSNLNTKSEQGVVAIKSHTAAMKDAHAMARGLSGSLGALWMTYGNMVPLAAGLALGASFRGVVKVGVDVEHTLESLRVKGLETVDSVNQMRASLYSLGEGIYGPRKVAEAFEILTLAGLNAQQSLIAVTTALNLAIAGDISIERSAETLVQVGTAMGYTAESFSTVADIIAKTAAVSMSSVESLSGSFKSASIVGSLYGVTLTDVGTALAALSQLGITHTAAGTSLKNMYKELVSTSEKVKSAFHDMKLKQEDLIQSTGDLKGLVEIVAMLDKGLKTVGQKNERDVVGRITNERGAKEMMALLTQYRTKVTTDSGEISNVLVENNKKIIDSYGFAAISAVQMAMTTKNQFESVKNTLETTFARVFKDIEPEMNVFAARLKEIFRSGEFRDAIAGMARVMASLAVTVAENLPLLTKLAAGFIAIKATLIAREVWLGVAAGVTAISSAIEALAAGAITASVALPALGAVLVVVAAAWAMYHLAKDNNNGAAEKANSDAYANNYIDGLTKEAERLELVTQKLKDKTSAGEADLAVSRDQARLEMQRLQNKSTSSAEDRLSAAKAALPRGISNSALAGLVEKGESPYSQVQDYIDAYKNLATVKTQIANQNKVAIHAEEILKQNAIENRLESDKAAARRKKETEDDIARFSHTDGKGASDRYQAELTRIQGEVDAAKRQLKNTESATDALFKTGEIGRLAQIQINGNAAIAMYEKEAIAYQKMIDVAAPKNKTAVKAAIGNKLVAAQENASQELVKIKEQESIRFSDLDKFTTEHQIKELEARGQFVEANMLKYGDLERVGLGTLDNDIAKVSQDVAVSLAKAWQTGGAGIPELVGKLELLKKAKDVFISESVARGNVADFDQTVYQVKTALKSVQHDIDEVRIAADVDGGWEAKFDAAGAANRIRATALPALEEMAAKLRKLSDENPTNGALAKQAEDLTASVQRMALSYDDAYGLIADGAAELGKKLEESFGKAAGAVGQLVSAMASQKSAQDRINKSLADSIKLAKDPKMIAEARAKASKASAQAEIKGYADMAGAAKGFFKENSKGYQVLTIAEKTFRAFEMALALESFVKKLFFTESEAGAVVVAEGTKAAAATVGAGVSVAASMAEGQAAAVTGVVTQAQGDPYSAWVRMAAMAATMAALGFAVSSGGGGNVDIAKQRQEANGTGTVLGDSSAKSDSIAKSLDLMKTNSSIELQFSSEMLVALRSIDAAMSGLAVLLLRSNGLVTGNMTGVKEGVIGVNKGDPALNSLGILAGPLGTLDKALNKAPIIGPIVGALQSLWGKTKQSIVDSGLTISGNIRDLIRGVGISQYTDVSKTTSSMFGLKKNTTTSRISSGVDSEISDQFSLIFKGLRSSLQSAGKVLGMDSATVGKAVEDFALKLPELSLRGLKGQELTDAINNYLSAAFDTVAKGVIGGSQDFQKVGEGYFETVMRVANGIDVAQNALDKLGIQMIKYTDIVNKQGDVSTELVRQSIVQKEGSGIFDLVKTAAVYAEKSGQAIVQGYSYLSEAQRSALMAQDAAARSATEIVVPASEKLVERLTGVGEIMQSLNGTADELISTYVKLTDIQKLMSATGLDSGHLNRTMIKGAGGLDSLSTGAQDFFDNFLTAAEQSAAKTSQLATEFTNLGLVMPKTKDQFKLMVQSFDDGTESGSKLVGELLALAGKFSAVSEAAKSVKFDNLDAAFSALQKSIEKQKTSIKDQYDAEIEAVKARTAKKIKAQQDDLKIAEDSLKSITSIFESLKNAIKSTQVESAALNMARRKEAQNALRGILNGGDLTKATGLDDALQTIAKPSDSLFSTFTDYALDQAKTANLIGDLVSKAGSQKDAAQLTIDGINATIEAIQKASDVQIKALEDARDSQIAELDKTLDLAQQQIDALHGIDDSVKSVEQALKSFNAALAAAKISSPVGAVNAQSAIGISSPASSSSPAFAQTDFARWQALLASNNSGGTGGALVQPHLPGFAIGTDYVPYDMAANIHEGERIIPAADNAELMNRLREPDVSNAQVVDAIKDLKQTIMSGDIANVQQAKELVKVVRKWDGNGMPEVRDVTE